MSDKIKNNKWLRDLLLISIVCLLIHGSMLILTGTFHDDWLSFFHDARTKLMEGYESGRPYYSLIIMMIWNLPGYGYRILAFFTYWAAYLFFYGTLCHIGSLTRRDAAMITLMTIAAPVNDARVLLANYPYAFGMLLFFAASLALTAAVHRLYVIPVRVGILALYFLSFTLNSNLVFYCTVLLYLLITFKVRKMYQFLDFILLPFLFYALNKILFPVYGAYSDYNIVTLPGLTEAVVSLPITIADNFISIVRQPFIHRAFWLTCAFLAVPALIARKCFKKKEPSCRDRDSSSPGENGSGRSVSYLVLFLFGLIAFAAGIFPYVVVRRNPVLSCSGIDSRDTILAGSGIAMMIYACAGKRLRTGIALFWCAAGLFHFNSMYLKYQTEWYRQLSFQRSIADLDLAPDGNYIVECAQESEIKDRRHCTWSGNAASVTGRRDLFLMNGKKDTRFLADSDKMRSIMTHYPMYSDYRFTHTDVNGTLHFSAEISSGETMRLKIYEIFAPRKFEQSIGLTGSLALDPEHND